jgi:hypothetical protein
MSAGESRDRVAEMWRQSTRDLIDRLESGWRWVTLMLEKRVEPDLVREKQGQFGLARI